MVKTTSLTTAAINALTTGDSSILYNNQTRDLVLYSGSIGFVESSIFNLEINNINGECLILKNNSSLTNYVNFNVSNQGQLNIITNGSSKIVNIHNHNGSSEGLSLGGTLITATATELNKLSGVTATTEELNYVDTTPGTAEASKALVVDANRDIANIRNLQTENLTVNGTLVTSSATELNYNDIATIGTAEPAKALVVDMNKDIAGINSLSATELTGEIQTASQPNITSVGTLTSLSTNSLTLNGTQVTTTAVELNKLSGATFNVSDLNKLSGVTATTSELNYVDTTPGTAEASKALVVDANRDITNIRNLQTENLTVNGTLVTSSATELNYNDIATIGTAEPAKALVVDMNKDISGINSLSANELSATELTGEIQTASQPNITSIGTLTSLSTNGLTLNGTQVTATATELNTMEGITATTSELNKLHGVTATTNEINKLSGLTSSTNELNILTGVTATYTELNVLDGITATTSELNYVDISTQGTAEASKALILDSNRDITNIRNLTATNINGTLATASQPNITSVGTLTSLSTNELTLNGNQVTATASELNYLSGITLGISQPSKVLTLNSFGNLQFDDGSGSGNSKNGTNALQWYGNTANKEKILMYRPNDDSGLVIASNPSTIQKCSPLLWLYSGFDTSGVVGSSSAEYREVLRSEHNLIGFSDNYRSGWFHGYLLASQPWGSTQGTQFYTSTGALNLSCNTTSTTAFASSNNLLLTTSGRMVFNGLTPFTNATYGNASVTLNNSNLYIKSTSSFNDGSVNYSMAMLLDGVNANPVRFAFQLHTGSAATSTNPAFIGTVSNNDFAIMSNNTRRMTLTAGGNLGIGLANPTSRLHISGSLTATGAVNFGSTLDLTGRFVTQGSVSIENTNDGNYPLWVGNGVNVNVPSGSRFINSGANSWGGGTIAVSIYSRWNIQADGYYVSSDKRLKSDIQYIDSSKALKILNITPCNFTWKESETNDFGVIAQDLVKENLTDLVKLVKSDRINKECEETGAPAESQFIVDYEKIGLYILEVVKKHNIEIEQLKEKNTQLENTIQNILTRLSNLEN